MTARTALEERTSSVLADVYEPRGRVRQARRVPAPPFGHECRGEPVAGRLASGLRGDHDMGERYEFRGAVPKVDARERVHPDDQHERLRAALGRNSSSVRIVQEAGTPKLAVVHHEVRIVADGGPDHFEPGRRVGEGRRAVRRIARRHECDGFRPRSSWSSCAVRRCRSGSGRTSRRTR